MGNQVFLNIQNFDIFFVGLAIVGIGSLGFIAYFNDSKSITNRTFLALSITAIIWGILNFLVLQFDSPQIVIWTLRFSVFFAVWYAFFVFQLFYVFPSEKVTFPKTYIYVLVPLTVLVSISTLTPFVFIEATEFTNGVVTKVTNGPGIISFGLMVVSLDIFGLVLLFRKIIKASTLLRISYLYLFIGASVTYVLIIIFNFIFPAFLNQSQYTSLAAIFTFPFIVLTSYAIIKHKLLNIKVLATEILAVVLSIITLIQIVFSESSLELVFNLSVFVLVLIFSSLLIRSVIREVEAREEIELLAKDLEKANVRLRELDKLKSEFVSIASHQLRSPLTAVKGYASLILEGSFGKAPEAIKEAVEKIFDSSQTMVASVEDFLNVSRIEQGRMKYEMSVFDVGDLAKKVIEELEPIAQKKQLKLSYSSESKENQVKADIGKIKQVISNLVDNAIKYTEKGSVDVNVSQSDDKIRIAVNDTGIGISAQTLPRLFDRFVRDRNANKVNVSGSGLGLYVAKQLVEGHKGRVWAESKGEGKGSTFIIEIPSS